MTRISTTPVTIHKPVSVLFGELAIAAGLAGEPLAVCFSESAATLDCALWKYFAQVAEGCGLKGVQVTMPDELTEALKTAVKEQMEDNVTTLIEVVLNQELGEPFRRDAMKPPVKVAGIDPNDMRPQQPV